MIVKDTAYLRNFINIANICIELDHWPSYFNVSSFIIVSKFNKNLYDSLKVFRPIVLLNTLNKLIEKVIDKRLSKNFIHPL